MQKRIGVLFSIALAGLLVLHIASSISNQAPLLQIVGDPLHLFCFFAMFASLLTIKGNKTFSWITQLVIIVSAAIWSLYDSDRGIFSGLSLFFIAILLAYSYGIYNKRPHLRISISCVVLYISFVFSPQCNDGNKYINAAGWLLFIVAMCFSVWMIFKDQLDRLQELERQNKERYMRIIEEATSVARDAIALCEEEKKKIQKER